MKILNLYAGIGGNRKLWGNKHKITAIEYDKNTAEVYKKNFPEDEIIITDAHAYLLKHYDKFDFIWSSPPCPSHSDIRRMGVDIGQVKPIYPDMKLYEEIIFLKQFYKGKWVIENVVSYYDPLIKPYNIARHYFWANFPIPQADIKTDIIIKNANGGVGHGFDIRNSNIKDKRKAIRNCVNP